MTHKFKHDQRVRCTLTGYKGVITGITTWRTGCIRYMVDALVEGKIHSEWIDEQQLTLVKAAKPRAVRKTGGPSNDP